MDRELYIKEIISRLSSKRAKVEIRRELEAHIDDRIDYFIDAGYDKETATQKAIDKMGNPYFVAKDMDKLYSRKGNVLIIVLIICYYALCLAFNWVTLLFDDTSISLPNVVSDVFWVVGFFTILYIARRKYWSWLCFLPITHTILRFATINYFYEGECTNFIVYFLNCLFTGKIDNYKFVTNSYVRVKFSDFLNVETKIFYAILIAFALVNFAYILVLTYKGKSIRSNKILKSFSIASIVIIVITACAFATICVGKGTYMDTYDKIYIYQSDEKIDIKDLDENDAVILEVNYDWTPYPDLEISNAANIVYFDESIEDYDSFEIYDNPIKIYDGELVELDSFVSYYKHFIKFDFYSDKKYVMVVMTDEYKDDKTTGWQKSNGYIYKDSIHYGDASFNNVEIDFY